MMDKSKIPYDKIDKGLVQIIRELNKLEFLVTTSCCAGHPDKFCDVAPDGKHSKYYRANLYITFEVVDEILFMELSKVVQTIFRNVLNENFSISKIYNFTGTYYNLHTYWRWGCWTSSKTKREVNQKLTKFKTHILLAIKKSLEVDSDG